MKKIGLFIISIISILGVGVSFADVIISPYEDQSKIIACVTKDSDIEDKVIILNYRSGEIYELLGKICIEDAGWNAFLLDKSIDINSINSENIENKGILIKDAEHTKKNNEGTRIRTTPFSKDFQQITRGAPVYIESLYKIGHDDEYGEMLILSLLSTSVTRMTGLPDYPGLSDDNIFYDSYSHQGWGFLRAWIITILIETIILFFIAKLFRKEDQISNRRSFFIGILASTITLPLLWYVFPLFIKNYTIYTIIGELLVALIEIFIIKYGLKVSRGKAILASVICNLCSYAVGILVL